MSDDAQATARAEALQVFEWYVDSAKWLVAIVAGTLTFGLSWLQSISANEPARSRYAIAAIVLIIAGALALAFIFVSYWYVSQAVSNEVETTKERRTKLISTLCFILMLLTFTVGMLLFIRFGVAQLTSMPTERPPELRLTALQARTSRFVAVAQRGDRLWFLMCQSDGSLVWRRGRPPG